MCLLSIVVAFIFRNLRIFLYFFAVLALSQAKEIIKRKRRGHYGNIYSLGNSQIDIGHSLRPPRADLYSYSHDLSSIPEYSTESIDLSYYQISSNSIEKPVQESQEYVPPQSVGAAVIPYQPPPATPVNAAASNVPGDGNSVFLGSGSLGVLNLGGGAYVLGSGALGYSEIRRNPRPHIRASTLPPIQASPNLLPAAVNSPEIPQQRPIFSYSFPPGHPSTDQNGYEFLSPVQAGFGDPLPQRRIKITNAYAVPTALQLQPSVPGPPQPQGGFQPLAQNYQSVPSALTVPQSLTQSVTVQSDILDIYPKRVNNILSSSSYFKK